MKQLVSCLLIIGSFFSAAQGQGTLFWSESINGPLGNMPATATFLGSMGLGTNSIIGTSEAFPIGQSWGVNADHFTFNVPTGLQISTLFFSADRQIWVWIGDTPYANQLGFLSNPANGNLLPQFGFDQVSVGNYGMYAFNHDLQSVPTVASYRLDFILTAVPEPGTWALLGLGSALLWCATHRRRK